MSDFCWRGLALSFLTFLISTGARGDLRIERLQTDESFNLKGEMKRQEERTQFVFLTEDSVRLDNGPTSIIVRLDDDVYIHLDHENKAYVELTLPLKLEVLLTEREKACMRQFPQAFLGPVATVTTTDERRTIAGYEARKVRVEWDNFVGLAFEEERWITKGLPRQAGLYSDLVRHRAALNPAYRSWIEEALAVGGYPLESKRTLRNSLGSQVVRQRFVSLTEVDPVEARYLPPADYSPSLERPPLDVACVGEPPR